MNRTAGLTDAQSNSAIRCKTMDEALVLNAMYPTRIVIISSRKNVVNDTSDIFKRGKESQATA